MSEGIFYISFSIAIIIGIVFTILDLGYRLANIKMRQERKNLWQFAFSKEEFVKADKMLNLICDAFLIPRKYQYRLSPNDRISMLYERNTRYSFGDTMEYENLSQDIKIAFNLNPDAYLAERSLTIGDLIRLVAKPKGGRYSNNGLNGTRVSLAP